MFLRFSFTVLLTSLLLALNVPDAGAAPLQHRQPKGMVTMPLRRLESNRANIHPQILLQQQINRSKKRLALMTDCAQPSEHELRSAIEKRMSLLSNDPLANATVVDKRFNHSGTHRNEGRTKRFNQAGTHRQHTRDFDSFRKAQNDGAQVVTVTVTAGAEPTPAAGNVNNDTPAASVPGSGNNNGNGVKGGANAGSGAGAAAGQNPGPTPAEIKAAQDNGVTAAEQPTASNSLGLEIFSNDVGYLGEVQIGTPPRTFTILMDSGSADFWVGADNCVSTSGGGCGNKNFLGSKESSSFVDSGVPFQVTYGTGAVAGSKITDNVVLAGLQLNTLDFGVAQQETPDFSADNVAFDGLMGLAQSTLSNQQVPTPVEKLKAQGLIKQAITSYKLGRVADGKNDGEITFGGLDTTRFDAASLAELDNVSKVGFWEAAMDAVSVNGADLGLQGRKAILDTGTTLILAPVDDATKVHQAIKGAKSDGQGGFIVPCTTTDVVELTFGGKQFSIDPRDLAFAPLDPNDPTGDCVSGISAGNIGDATEWLVGDTFLKSVYFSHNVDTNTMSLAKLK